MTRKAFWLSLFPAVGMAVPSKKKPDGWNAVTRGVPVPLNPPVPNPAPGWQQPVKDGCPVCGNVAAPYIMRRGHKLSKCMPIEDETMGKILVCKGEGEPVDELSQIVRCVRCNAAFFQDGV